MQAGAKAPRRVDTRPSNSERRVSQNGGRRRLTVRQSVMSSLCGWRVPDCIALPIRVSASVCRVYLLLFRVHAFDRPAAAAIVEEEAYVAPGAQEPAYAGLGAVVF